MTEQKISRHEWRAYAMITLFQMHVGKHTADKALEYTALMLDVEPNNFAKGLVTGVSEQLEKIDEIIEKNTDDWKVERIGKVELTALRIAVYEMLEGDAPKKVIVNEALELVKAYSDEPAKKFTNSVLQNLMTKFS